VIPGTFLRQARISTSSCHPGQLRRHEELIQGLPNADLRLIGKSGFPYLIESLNHYLLESLKLTGVVVGLGMTKLRYSIFAIRCSIFKRGRSFSGGLVLSTQYGVLRQKIKN